MKRGFVTIATGEERYYEMARTLLRSYRQNAVEPMPFSVISDRQNKYTDEFDDVIILDNPNKNWMDKMCLLNSCPYDETIFIDADCLIYQDIQFLWDVFGDADDFSCFGKVLPLDSRDGWFTKDAANVFPIQFITHLHGILYFIRKGAMLSKMEECCKTIISRYNEVTYKGFNDQLADEPVYALAMAILGLKPVDRKPYYYCFVPFATKISSDYANRTVTFQNPVDGDVDSCCIVHWGHKNTQMAPYRSDAYVVDWIHLHPTQIPRFQIARTRWYRLCDFVRPRIETINYMLKRIRNKIKEKLGYRLS